MTREEKIAYTRKALDGYRTLRTDLDQVEWVMLKLSCSRKVAAGLVKAARREEVVSTAEVKRLIQLLRSQPPQIARPH